MTKNQLSQIKTHLENIDLLDRCRKTLYENDYYIDCDTKESYKISVELWKKEVITLNDFIKTLSKTDKNLDHMFPDLKNKLNNLTK